MTWLERWEKAAAWLLEERAAKSQTGVECAVADLRALIFEQEEEAEAWS